MDTPVTKKFFIKLELYLELKRQDKRSTKSKRGKMIWSMEKSFLLWAVRGHWHLGTPLTPEYVKDRLLEDGFSEEEVKYTRQVAQNLVFKRFACNPINQNDTDTIQMTDEGFMMGEVVEEANGHREYFYILFIIFVWMTVFAAFLKVVTEILKTLGII